MKAGLVAALHQPGIEVARHTVMAERIGPVGRDVDFNHPVALEMVILGGRHAHDSVVGQHDDAGMVGADTYLILGAYHAEALHAAQLRFLDGEFLVAVIEHAAQVGHNHLLSGGHIGCSADNLLGLALAEVNRRDVEMIAIGMWLTGEHLAHIKAFQPSFDGLHFVQRIHLKTGRRQSVSGFLRREVEVDIFLQPLV